MSGAVGMGGWILEHAPTKPFLVSDIGTLTYGDLAQAEPPARPGPQAVVTPGADLASVVDLMAALRSRSQTVVVDPGLPEDEKQRRLGAAAQAASRSARTILFTSGTTGPAKAVRLTDRNWEAAASASADHLSHTADDVWLAAMPLHHVGGLSILYRTAHVGAEVRWLPSFDTARVVAALRGGVTLASLVPTMLRRVLSHDTASYRDLRAVLVGGGPIPPGLLEEAHSRGIPALPTYGMTETCAQVATLRPDSPARYAAHLLPGVEVHLDADERIWLRGDQISPGYADEDDRDPTDWFPTPDRGGIEPDGALVVRGRLDDVVVTGGENVDPGEVEAVMLSHPAVEAAAVTGVPDPEWGSKLVAGYTGEVDAVELTSWLSERLARYQIPRLLHRLDALPTTGGGKPDRQALADLLGRPG